MKSQIKRAIALTINILIVMFSLVGALLSFEKHGVRAFEYYTENSNYISLIVSLIFCISCVISIYTNKNISRWVHVLRYTSTLCLSVTLVVVLVVLVPMMPTMFNELMFKDVGLYYHLICPILSIISFVLFENEILFNKKDVALSLIPTIVYGVVIITLNLFKVIQGPYPFLYFYKFKWYQSLLFLLGIVVVVVVLSMVLFNFRNSIKYKKRHKKSEKLVKI